jgi:hypothetical protein
MSFYVTEMKAVRHRLASVDVFQATQQTPKQHSYDSQPISINEFVQEMQYFSTENIPSLLHYSTTFETRF